ncbi:MAG: hypothetical protein HY713_13325 [candidate division NC10 bacterium]|nr:hypothetical protein [candidate division NC10 bacterium]
MQWRLWMRTAFLGLLGLALAACAGGGSLGLPTVQPTVYPPPGFVHRVASSHVDLYWNCARPAPDELRLEGLAFNPWASQRIRFLEFELVGVDARERTVSEAKGEAGDFLLGTNQSTPFQLNLRPTGSEVRFDLFYQYRFNEGNDGRLFAGPPGGRPLLLAQAMKRFMARDVCSESQHRAR